MEVQSIMKKLLTLILVLVPTLAQAQITIEWDAVPEAEAYLISWSTNPDAPINSAEVGKVTQYKFTRGLVGATYYFWVQSKQVVNGEVLLSRPIKGQPISQVYSGVTETPPPTPGGPGPTTPPTPPLPDPTPSTLPVLMPPATQCVTPAKDIWQLVPGQFGNAVFHGNPPGYLTWADELNCRTGGVTMRQGINWFLWEGNNWKPTGTDEATSAPPEICGDKIDNNGNGQIDELPECVELPAPVNCTLSAWSEWSAWSAWKPINAQQEQRSRTRTRTMLTEPQNGGTCEPLTETEYETRAITVTCTLSVVVTAWPKTNTDSTQFRYDPSQPIKSFTVMPGTTQIRSAVFTGFDNCSVTVK